MKKPLGGQLLTMRTLRQQAEDAGFVIPSDDELAKMLIPSEPTTLLRRQGIMQTHTYALLEVSDRCYDEVEARLKNVEYGHAISDEGEIDMHGIALVKETLHTGRQRASSSADLPCCPRCNSMDLGRKGPTPSSKSNTGGLTTHANTLFICQKCGLEFTSDDLGKDMDRRQGSRRSTT